MLSSAPVGRVLRGLGPVIWAVTLVGLLTGCSLTRDQPEELLVFAAASLADALGEIEDAFEEERRVGIAISYGGSQMLAQQIASGAPANIFISAGESPVDFLIERELLDPEVSDLLTNRLVVAVRVGGTVRLESVEQLSTSLVERVALANPELAPAGRYARESLEKLGLWDELQPKLVFGADVRATLAYLESGNVEAALVYVTDARAGRNVEVLDIVPNDSYSRIVYPAAVVKVSSEKEGVKPFLEFLQGATAQEIFRKHGFEPAQ